MRIGVEAWLMAQAAPKTTSTGGTRPDRNVGWPVEEITVFCRRWQITRLGLFGSVLREDFGPDSDVDILARFHPAARHTLLDLERMEDELESILGRDVDLLSWRGVERSRNRYRRKAILGSVEVVYDA